MEFEVLGPLRVRSEAGAPELRVRAQHGLLAVLLTSPNVAISDDRLIDELWGEDPPASARHVLQVYASELRGILGQAEGPRVVRDGNGRWLDEPCGKGPATQTPPVPVPVTPQEARPVARPGAAPFSEVSVAAFERGGRLEAFLERQSRLRRRARRSR